MTRSKVSLHEHNGDIESIMISTKKHNNVILGAKDHSIIAQLLSIMCQGLLSTLIIESAVASGALGPIINALASPT